jgi:hypothetical protein
VSSNIGQKLSLIGIIILITSILTVVAIYNSKNKDIVESDSMDKYYPAIKIVVQNGCGFSGVANNVKHSLADKNVDVVNVNNTRKFIYDETLIVVKHNDEDDLRRLKSITGINNVIYAVNDSYIVPFIVIAGKDYQNYFK